RDDYLVASCILAFFSIIRRPQRPTLFPYTTLFRSNTRRERSRDGLPPRTRSNPSRRKARNPASDRDRPERLTCRESPCIAPLRRDRKSTRLNSSHVKISYAVFCLKKKIIEQTRRSR